MAFCILFKLITYFKPHEAGLIKLQIEYFTFMNQFGDFTNKLDFIRYGFAKSK